MTVWPFAEGLSDRRAADAVRGRIAWTYALGLALTDAGFDPTVVRAFRTRLVQGKAEQGVRETLPERVREAGLLKTRGRQRTDSTPVFAAGRVLNRRERVGETRRAALHALAVRAPEGLQQQVPPEWFERYGSRVEHDDLPEADAARQQRAWGIGEGGQHLLHAVDRATGQPWLAQVPAVITLRRLWSEQYLEEPGQLRRREVKEMPAAADQLTAPDDTDARYSPTRHVEWVGDTVHRTETGGANTPHLRVSVETTPATPPDAQMAAVGQAS